MKTLKWILPLAAALMLGLSFMSPEPAARTPVKKTGHVTSWSLDMDGTLVLRLEEASGEEFWFVTPPDLSDIFAVEEMLMQVLLLKGPEQALSLTGDREPGEDGASRERALELLQIALP